MITSALIPAAGRGIRAYPKTVYMPKVMLEIDGRPIIERNVEILRDSLGIRDITIIVGYLGEQIRERLGDGGRLGVSIRYVECPEPEIGLARGVLLAKQFFNAPFITLLGDELYLNSNHGELKTLCAQPFDAVCGLLRTEDLHQIKRNYSVRLEHERIASLVEKPVEIENDLLGCGTYLFTPEIFDAIEQTTPSERSGRVELTDAINTLAARGRRVLPFLLRGDYFNINTIDDYNYAQYKERAARFPQYKTSVVIPAFNEEQSIAYVVRDFRDVVDEVFVVDNSSADRTAEVAREAGARVETVKLKGYGDTIRYGLDHATGDILVVVEADFSFRARDLDKLLEYLKDADMVVGTRTTRELVEQGTNMRGPVRWGNVLVAKFVESLWWGQQPRFTDVGCTYRALWRETYHKMRPLLHGTGPELSPEMMVAALEARQRIIEVPVSYHRRIGGESKHSANYFKVSQTAFRMLRTIMRKRLGRTNGRQSQRLAEHEPRALRDVAP
ncbi:MAG: glycosyltransferase [Acidobacteria bacterium]|nr:glycosyltransferase [Acidobacteriota bacterium]